MENKVQFRRFGTMIDCSRNAVPTVASLKEWLRMKAIMGFNAMMLYTEDTFEIEYYTIQANKWVWYALTIAEAVILVTIVIIIAKIKDKKEQQTINNELSF